MKPLSKRGTANVSCAILVAGATVLSCGGSGSSIRPVPSLAVSLEAQSSFQPIREQWLLSTMEERASLESRLEAFGLRYRSDPLARVAEAYLAFIALDRGKPAEARAMAQRVREGPSGNTRDLGTLIDGASLAREGKPEAALQLLDPLVGRMIDSFAQDLLHEAVVGAAVDAHRWYQAVVYMNEWLRATNEQDMAAVRAKVDKLLGRFPPGSLESALRAMGASKQGDIWEKELREAVAARLAAVAMERSDPNLARSVLETSRTVVGMGEAGTSLAQLATSGGRAPRIIGARVGLVVETDERLRLARSAEAVAGALAVFKPDRSMDLEPGHPGAEPPVLVTRDVPRDGTLADALDDLAYQGVSIIVGGYDPERSAELATYAESESIPVILLVAPKTMPAGARFTFVAGTAEPSWTTAVSDQAARQVDPARSARVGVGKAPEQPLVASCDRRAVRAGETTFPVATWQAANVESVAIDGPAWCARGVVRDLKATRFSPTLFLGLEAREAATDVPGRADYPGELRVASCGYLDASDGQEPAALKTWRAETGHPPTWFDALGRDAAQLAHDAVAPLPRGTFTSMDEVVEARGVVQQGLLRVVAPLWTTTARGFGGKRQLPRKVRYIQR
jgi:hypothetical protein